MTSPDAPNSAMKPLAFRAGHAWSLAPQCTAARAVTIYWRRKLHKMRSTDERWKPQT